MFRRYTTIHILSTVAAFSVAAVWIVISFTRHNTATRDCEAEFFPPEGNTGQVDTESQGPILCNIFSWVTAGLMAALWVVLVVMQVCAPYGSQRMSSAYMESSSTFTQLYRHTAQASAEITTSTTPSILSPTSRSPRTVVTPGTRVHPWMRSVPFRPLDSMVTRAMRVIQVSPRFSRRSRNKTRSMAIPTSHTPLSVSRRTHREPFRAGQRWTTLMSHSHRTHSHKRQHRHLKHTTTITVHTRTTKQITTKVIHKGIATPRTTTGGMLAGMLAVVEVETWRRQAVRRHTLVCDDQQNLYNLEDDGLHCNECVIAEGSFGRKTPRRQSSNYSQYHTRQPSYGGGAGRRY